MTSDPNTTKPGAHGDDGELDLDTLQQVSGGAGGFAQKLKSGLSDVEQHVDSAVHSAVSTVEGDASTILHDGPRIDTPLPTHSDHIPTMSPGITGHGDGIGPEIPHGLGINDPVSAPISHGPVIDHGPGIADPINRGPVVDHGPVVAHGPGIAEPTPLHGVPGSASENPEQVVPGLTGVSAHNPLAGVTSDPLQVVPGLTGVSSHGPATHIGTVEHPTGEPKPAGPVDTIVKAGENLAGKVVSGVEGALNKIGL